MAQARTAKTAAATTAPGEPVREKTGASALPGLVGHHDGEDGEDGDGANVDHDLREADKLGAQLQIQRGEAGKADRQREHAVDGVAQAHGRRGSGDGDDGEDEEGAVIVESARILRTNPCRK